ncbi:MAG TPA: tetratricopeptide repeat protein [Planktothrix sp.]|jgi:Flp pilus assembly protein TadD
MPLAIRIGAVRLPLRFFYIGFPGVDNPLTPMGGWIYRLPEVQVQSRAEQAYEQGMELLARGEYLIALEAFAVALEFRSDFAAVYFSRAYTYTLLEQFDKAVADYSKAITLDHLNPWAYLYRSYAHAAQGNQDLVVQDCSEAININPRLSIAYIERGYAAFKLGRYDEAANDFTSFITLNPNDSSAYFCRAIAHSELNNQEKCVQDLTMAIKYNPNDFSAYFCRGIAFQHLGEFQNAIDDYNQALAINPEYCQALANREAAEAALVKARMNSNATKVARAKRTRKKAESLLVRLQDAVQNSPPADVVEETDEERRKRVDKKMCRTPSH